MASAQVPDSPPNDAMRAPSKRCRGRPRAQARAGVDAHSRGPLQTTYVLHNLATETAYVSEGSLRRAVLRYNSDMRELDPSGSLDMHTSSLCRWLGKDPSRRRPTSKGVSLSVFDRQHPPDFTAMARNIVRC